MEGSMLKPALSKYLIIDTGGFIKNAPLQEMGQNLVTMHEVIAEIRDKETKERLKALPYHLEYMEPDPDSIKKVTDFARKTGDFVSLSATDIKVVALTLMLEIRHLGQEHLPTEPQIKKTIEFYKPGDGNGSDSSKLPVGFFTPENEDDADQSEDLESGMYYLVSSLHIRNVCTKNRL